MRLLSRVTFVAILFGALLVPASGQDKAKPAKSGGALALMKLLSTEFETRGLHEPVKLKQALEYLHEKFGGKLVILVDKEAFMAILGADAPDIYDEEVRLPPVPAKMSAGVALRLILSQVASGKAVYILRQGYIEVIPEEHDRASLFLRRPILAIFEKRPLEDILNNLSEMSGLTINVDERVGAKAKTPISATFRNTPLEDALVIATESADLKFVVMSNSVLVTTPAHAAAIAKEQKKRQAAPSKEVQPQGKALTKIVRESKSHAETLAVLRVLQTQFTTPKELRDGTSTAAALEIIEEKSKAAGTPLTIAFDHDSLRKDKEFDEIFAGRLPPTRPRPLPARMSIKMLLDQIIAQSSGATYIIRQGRIDVVNVQDATAKYLIGQPVLAAFDQRPLHEVLGDLADLTGLSITIDPGVGDKVNLPISAVFRNNVTLNDALRNVTEMAGLKFVLLQQSVYVTTPTNAAVLR